MKTHDLQIDAMNLFQSMPGQGLGGMCAVQKNGDNNVIIKKTYFECE